MSKWLGIDIGGANIKFADLEGNAKSLAFPLWQRPYELAAFLEQELKHWPSNSRLAITMTGELADCYADKATGVREIATAVNSLERTTSSQFYTIDGNFLTYEQVHANPLVAAASNWHATATFLARQNQDATMLLIDMGTTTTDVIPIRQGKLFTKSRTDVDRLRSNELLYFGWLRTPVCAIIQAFPYRGASCPVAAEVFSTVADAAVVAGILHPRQGVVSPADERSLASEHSIARLGRQVCATTGDDAAESEWTAADAETASAAILEELSKRLGQAVDRVRRNAFGSVCTKVSFGIVGSGAELARHLLANHVSETELNKLSDTRSHQLSTCAPAEAVAWLAREAFGA